MFKKVLGLGLLLGLSTVAFAQQPAPAAQAPRPPAIKTHLKVGDLNRTHQDWDTQAASSKSSSWRNLINSASTSGS